MNELSGHKVFARIHRYKGTVLGALLWVPAPVFEKSMAPGQETVEVSFEGNHIIVGKEEKPAVHA